MTSINELIAAAVDIEQERAEFENQYCKYIPHADFKWNAVYLQYCHPPESVAFRVWCAAKRSMLERLQVAEDAAKDAADSEREAIGCFLEAKGQHSLASQVFAGLGRPINEDRRNAAIAARRLTP
jgi:hypothetical protein